MNRLTAKAGIGIYITCRVNLEVMDVFVSAKAANRAIPIQAEAAKLTTVAHVVFSLILQDLIVFTDSKGDKCFGKQRYNSSLGNSAASDSVPGTN
jgi:hypothetical protein